MLNLLSKKFGSSSIPSAPASNTFRTNLNIPTTNFSKVAPSLHQNFQRYISRPRDKGFLILEDGSCYQGNSFGAHKPISGEVVFNTGMVGYPENLTDPSYASQILMFTYPLVGNYGVPPRVQDKYGLLKYFESNKIHVSGMLVAEYSEKYSHWNAERSLSDWLASEGIPALSGIDTRELTQKLRSNKVMLGKIIFDEDISLKDPFTENLVAKVGVKEPVTYGKGPYKIIAIDCGIKYHMIRSLLELGPISLKVVPWDYDFNNEEWDGLFISNGPGDPRTVEKTIQNIAKAYNGNKPIFGICMGNQLMALAAGATVYKLPFGNRGQNQPVIDTTSGRVYITPQNHGYAVDNLSLPADWIPAFINANDGSNEGIRHRRKPFFSVQFHPEARSGPSDTRFLFEQFFRAVVDCKASKPFSFVNTAEYPKKVLILGSGALQIGQAGEFDYSGSQAIKALKEENIKVVLINPNIATVQTAKDIADEVYFLPVTAYYCEQVIKKERPDAIFLGFGGQTALNTGLQLHKLGILSKYGVRVLGTSVKTIEVAEDRELFKQALAEIGEPCAPSISAVTVEEAIKAANEVKYPVIVRAAFALGGLGSGFATNDEELIALVKKALAVSPQVLVEKSLKGWKEVEYEVVRDAEDNCITVCNMENFDPMGIHTGESIVVAPSQTLSNEEYHLLREAAVRTIKHLQIVGECNIQYALDPNSEQYYVIEVNPRLSRSSALASKATGYPLAFVAAKLGLGIPLPEVRNSVTKITSACFEPSLDYIVTKMPRWDLGKFSKVIPQISSQMKSVGEVMAVGRTFEESLQKAIRLINTSTNKGFEPKPGKIADLDDELRRPTPMRIYALAEALEKGYTVEKLHDMTKIDHWFLHKLNNIHLTKLSLKQFKGVKEIPNELLRKCKEIGLSDKQIGELVGSKELDVRAHRKSLGIVPAVKQIDTLAAEFPAKTNYLYMTYHDKKNDIPQDSDSVLVLGSGTYRIGSSVEFDYCSVSAIRALRKAGEKTIMINYNPETVSTDYDESDKLYFEELTLERVLDVIDRENPKGVIVSVGGQEAQNLALPLYEYGVPIMGTSPKMIDMAEDRYKFSQLLDKIGVTQPEWKELSSKKDAVAFADRVGFPVLVRPSYVLSGAAMKVAWTHAELDTYLDLATEVSPLHPVVITSFVLGAKEIELDAVAQRGELINWAVSEHIENAGVHSGDASITLPPYTLSEDAQDEVKTIGGKIAQALKISGPMNVQFLYKDGKFSVIECNLRASRSFPFVSKTYDVDFIGTAVDIFLGKEVEPSRKCERKLQYSCFKAPQFSFPRIHGSDPVLGVEMASTGEVATYGKDVYEAGLKSYLAVHNGFRWPEVKKVLLTGDIPKTFVSSIQTLQSLGYKVHANSQVIENLKGSDQDLQLIEVEKPTELISEKKIDFVVNIPSSDENPYNYEIRRKSVEYNIPLFTNQQVAEFIVAGISKYPTGKLSCEPYSHYLKVLNMNDDL